MAHPRAIVLVILTLFSLGIPTAAAEPSNGIGLHEHTAATAALAATGDIALAGHVGGIVSGLAVQSNYAYIGVSSELAVLDISDSGHPMRVGSVMLSERVQRIIVAGHYVYAATYAGLHVIDASDPTVPVQVGALSINVEDIAVANNYLYVAGSNGVSVVDVSTPSLPIVLASVAGVARRVAVAGFWMATFPLGFHAITRHDGVVSILRGFTRHELESLITMSTGARPTVSHRIGYRITASWRTA